MILEIPICCSFNQRLLLMMIVMIGITIAVNANAAVTGV